MAASVASRSKRPNAPEASSTHKSGGTGGKPMTCAQRIEAATRHRVQVSLTEMMVQDAEALFKAHDNEGTQLLSRGALTELMREIGLETLMGDAFGPTARLVFDSHSADSHFLSMQEFKHLYYVISTKYPGLLPRTPFLDIHIISAKGLPPADVNGKADPFVVWQIPGKPQSKAQTTHKDKTLEPVWRERFHDKYTYEEGDPIKFTVYDFDYGAKEFESIGEGRLPSSEFHKQGGYEGEIRLIVPPECGKGFSPTLKLKVLVNALEPKKPAEAAPKTQVAARFKAAVQGVKASQALGASFQGAGDSGGAEADGAAAAAAGGSGGD